MMNRRILSIGAAAAALALAVPAHADAALDTFARDLDRTESLERCPY